MLKRLDATRLVEEVSAVALQLPAVTACEIEGQPAFRVQRPVMAWFLPDAKTLAVKIDLSLLPILAMLSPLAYSTAGHLNTLERVHVRLQGISHPELWLVLVAAWRYAAPKGCMKRYAQVVNDLETAALQ